jgi:cell division protein FtsZ
MAGDFFMSAFEPRANIKVLGIGGCGGNAVSYMIEQGLQGAEFLAANTDLQALSLCKATKKVQLGDRVAGGLGVGCNPEKGKKAAEESLEELQRELENVDMLFLTGGMGGGTGTGGLPVAAQLARELGILTVAVVTKPFTMEGQLKSKVADDGVRVLEELADSVIIIPNQRVLDLDKKLTFKRARAMVDEVLYKAVKGIIDIVQFAGILNVDMEDVRAVMKCRGRALMGMGHATGEAKTLEAITEAVSNPLVENDSIDGCTGALINITANGDEFTSEDLEVAVSTVSEHAAPDAVIKAGLVERPDLQDEIYITVIATGFDTRRQEAPRREPIAQHKVRTSTDSRTTIVPGQTQKVRRITDANQTHLPLAGESEELAFSEEITSIPAFITHMQKTR